MERMNKMEKSTNKKIDDLIIELLASEEEETKAFGAFIQGGKALYQYKVISTFVTYLLMPAIVNLLKYTGTPLPTEEELEKTSKEIDTKILKFILRNGHQHES